MVEQRESSQVENLVCAVCPQPGGPWFVELRNGAVATVRLGPYGNPALAREDAERIETFLEKLLAGKPPDALAGVSEHDLFS